MVDILDSLGELEGHEFTHAGQTYTVVTVTANRTPLDARDDETPIQLHFTVTTPGRQAPIGLELRLSTERARDLAGIRQALEQRIASIVDAQSPSGTKAQL